MSKNKKLKELFAKDIEPLLKNNLDYSQIKDKITINENIITYDNIYHTQHKNRKIIKNRYKFAGALLSLLIITCISLLMIKDNNKDNQYNISPYSDQLQGVIFGGQIKTNVSNLISISNFIDQQKDNKNPLYFYEVDAKKVDNYYTCAYLPTEYYEEALEKYSSSKYLDYSPNTNIIDGKLIYGYSNLNIDKDIKWYQFEKDISKVPLTIDDYSLGLILESRDIYFYANKTLNKQLKFNKKIFIRNFYNIETKEFDNSDNLNYFMLNINNQNLVLSYNLIENNKIEDLNFFKNYEINNNEIIIKTANNINFNILGHYQEQLTDLLISSKEEEDGTYGYYNYQEFCNKFLSNK